MKYNKAVFILTMLASTTACSKAPTDEEAKSAIQGLIGSCPYLSIENFQKINGIQQGEIEYTVQVKYTIKSKAIPESQEYINGISGKINEINAKLEEAKKLKEENVKTDNQIRDQYGLTSPEMWKFRSEKMYPSVKAVEELEKQKESASKGVKETVESQFFKACPDVNNFLYANLFEGIDIIQRGKDFSKEFSGNIPMIKTDNGWMFKN